MGKEVVEDTIMEQVERQEEQQQRGSKAKRRARTPDFSTAEKSNNKTFLHLTEKKCTN